jgi:hypothetical protein
MGSNDLFRCWYCYLDISMTATGDKVIPLLVFSFDLFRSRVGSRILS